MENIEKFERWIIDPLEALRAMPHGNGAFVAIPAIMALLNGLVKAVFYRALNDPKSPDSALPTDEMVANFLGADVVGVRSWRHAMSAESWGMFLIPKKRLRIGAQYGAIPSLGDDGRWEVDPWKFADLVLSKASPDLIEYFPLTRAYVEDD